MTVLDTLAGFAVAEATLNTLLGRPPETPVGPLDPLRSWSTVAEPAASTVAESYALTVAEPAASTVAESCARTVAESYARTLAEPAARTVAEPDECRCSQTPLGDLMPIHVTSGSDRAASSSA